ncbi:hypothetical protein [Marispirochaeta sp.]|uniref:hypothetical protein n=1 Tax=Marispirochaeta sp. TaxID=2038653 RepID=UPI0029C67EB4|nr:hypothetical protein [Marispirochaeta sp.]
MRFITELHKKHLNKPVWIAGSDPTLGEYPDSFFDDKIGITLHMAHVKFPEASYRYANEYDRVEYLKKEYSGFSQQEHIFAWPFYGKCKKESRDLIRDMESVYHLRWMIYPPRGIREYVDWSFTHYKVKQARAGKSVRYGGHGTCLHGALYAAIMMGGNPINIIGAGHGKATGIGDAEHFGTVNEIDQVMRPGIRSFSDPVNNVPMIEQTLAIMEGCRREGIEVNWYMRYDNGGLPEMQIDYEEIERQKKELANLPKTASRRVKNAIKSAYRPFLNRL